MIAPRFVCVYTLAAGLLLAPFAHADGADKTAAIAAFDEAAKLADAGKYAEACPKFAESNRLDPQLGALMHLADCYEQAGLLASAWAAFHEAAEIAEQRDDQRLQVASARARSLEGRLSRLRIRVSESGGTGFEVRRDGMLVGPALWGSPLPVDGGKHTVTASAPGRQTWTTTVSVGATGVTEDINVPPLAREQLGDTATAPPVASTAAPAQRTVSPAEATEEPSSTRKLIAWSAIAAGTLSAGLGTVFLFKRSNTLSSRDAICAAGDPSGCPTGSQARVDELTGEARSADTLATVGLAAGGVLAAGGLVLLLTAPDEPAAQVGIAPILGTRFGGIMVTGNVF